MNLKVYTYKYGFKQIYLNHKLDPYLNQCTRKYMNTNVFKQIYFNYTYWPNPSTRAGYDKSSIF